MNIKDLCRLCAARVDFSKDLADENNKNVLKMIQEFVKIEVTGDDELPTKICLDCEEKIVSFQLFVMECYKVQDTLKNIHLENNENIVIKFEDDVAFLVSDIKAEVKDEITADDIVSAINNETLSETDETIYDTNNDDDHHSDDDFDEDDVTIASLKQRKESKKIISEEDAAKLNEILMRSNLGLNDFVKCTCHVCGQKWSRFRHLQTHTIKIHKTRPKVFCICGVFMRSKTILYNHIRNHKRESREMRQKTIFEKGTLKTKTYSRLKLKEFINFICQTCEKECLSWYKLKIHCEKFHNVNPVVRCTCGVLLKSKSVVYKHVQDHNNPNALCCDKCPRITKTEAAMIKHKMRHVPKSERKFVCETCNKIFHTKDCLKSHKKSHIPIEERKIYHCDSCNMKFTTRSSAASHKRVVHEKIKSYVCDLCGYACGTNGELRQHRAIHSDEKPFVCSKCSKSFKTYSNLKTHMDTHEDTSYACYVCNRVLNSRRTLRKHLLVHEDKARHVCSFCNKAFKRRQTLKVHMYTHTGDKPLSCKWCEEKFAYASTLRSHRLRCHPDKVAAHNYIYNNSHVVTAVRQGFNINEVDAVTAKNEMEAPQ